MKVPGNVDESNKIQLKAFLPSFLPFLHVCEHFAAKFSIHHFHMLYVHVRKFLLHIYKQSQHWVGEYQIAN